MIIDFHTHTFPEKIAERAVASLRSKSHTVSFSDGTAGGLMERDRAAGIDLAVILPVATNPEQVRHVNDKAAALNREYGQKRMKGSESCGTHAADTVSFSSGLLSFACIHPEMEDAAAELGRVNELGFKGVKLHPVYQGTDIDSLPFLKILDSCAGLGLTVVTHGGWDIGFPGVRHCMPDQIRRAVRTVDPEGKTLKLVAAHMGGWRIWEEVPELLADTGVYLDTSFSTGQFYPLSDGYYDGKDISMLDTEGFMTLYRAFGPERILFGTDNPWSDAAESLAFIRALPITEEEKGAILGGSARKLLGFV